MNSFSLLFPPPRMPALKQRSEKSIQSGILRWLKKTGLVYWRQNAGVLFRYGFRMTLGPKGIPDIIVIIPPFGRFIGLEVKSAKGKLRPAQEVFRKRLLKVGGVYRVVRSLKDAKEAVEEAKAYEKLRNAAN